MAKKLLAAILAAAAVCAFSACKKEEVKTDVPVNNGNDVAVTTPVINAEDENGEIDYEAGLSIEKFDGYEYRILISKGNLNDQDPEEDSEELVESAVFKRNKQIEDRFGITITGSESSKGGYETDALNSILAGDDAYDIIFTHSRAAFTYAVQGAAYNINEIESIHLDMPWWSKNIKDNCTVNGRLYVLDGDISLALESTMCMFFNKRIFDELGFDYPYESVKDGDWTFDEFAYYAKKGGADLNGDGVILPEDDRYGFTTSEWAAPINILYTGGQKIYDLNDEGILELTLYSNKTVDIFDEFFGLLKNEACFLQFTEGNINYTGEDMFKAGRSMITTAGIGSAKGYRDMDDDFGIIPYPKFDEEDEYATAINGAAPLAIIPITVSDVERTGAITEALCAYGSKDVIPAFYEVSLKTKYSRDEDSEEMLDLIKDSIIFDIGYLAGGPFQSVGRDISKTATRDFASFYASKATSAETKLAEFNRDYGGVED